MPMTKAKSSFIVKYELVNGDTAATNIAVSGITTDDILVHVIEEAVTTAISTDRTSVATITSAGNIQLSASTSADKLHVLWVDVDA